MPEPVDLIEKMSRPPWTLDQVGSLNHFQKSGTWHPFTCAACRDHSDINDENEYALTATTEGWECVFCGYTQTWAWPFMADWSWRDFSNHLMPGATATINQPELNDGSADAG